MLNALAATLARHSRLAAVTLAAALLGVGGTLATLAPAAASTPGDEAACAAATNHGAYVSSVARATKGMPDHGALVSAAARSDCGKAAKAEKAEKAEKAVKAKPHKPKAGKKEGN